MPLSHTEITVKLAELRSLHVPTDRDREFRKQLDRLLQVDVDGRQLPAPVRFAADLETRGITMIDGPGSGKTTTINRCLSRCAALNPPGEAPRYLPSRVPSPATLKSLGLEILKGTGFSGVSDRARVWQIWDAVRHRLSERGILVLWIDEAQDLFLSRSAREIEDMLKTLKRLMQGETGVIVILSGTERLSEITSFDPQVDRRFTKVVPRPLIVGVDEARVGQLVADYAAKAGLGLEWSRELSSRLIHASRGRFGRAVETVINAIERALTDGDGTLTGIHFAEAWGMQEGCPWEENVFIAPDWAARILDAAAEEFEAARTRRQRKQLERS
jgi:hypothetical protein